MAILGWVFLVYLGCRAVAWLVGDGPVQLVWWWVKLPKDHQPMYLLLGGCILVWLGGTALVWYAVAKCCQ